MNLSRCGGFIWIQINNCLTENNEQNRDCQRTRDLFILLGNKLVLNLIWKSTQLTKIFTKPMRVHCLLLSVVSGERKGVQPPTENSIGNKTSLLGRWMWLDWMIETNNQIIPKTFILINFCEAGCITKRCIKNASTYSLGRFYYRAKKIV